MSKLKVLVACEQSGVVRDAFRNKGCDAYSCDILPNNSEFHIQDDVLKHLDEGWDLMIAHPTCTYLCNSGVHWLHKDPSRWDKLAEARGFFNSLLNCGIPKLCVENPIPHKYAKDGDNGIGQYTQIIQPYQFGEDASKATCLWLKNLPKLIPTNIIKKKRYANQTPSGQNKLGPSNDRWKLRSRTYEGIAEAMANQWGEA
tara:strand:+ start:49 stop:648 length:600 start_codon:yes stop_codon:yes gene_type:complete